MKEAWPSYICVSARGGGKRAEASVLFVSHTKESEMGVATVTVEEEQMCPLCLSISVKKVWPLFYLFAI